MTVRSQLLAAFGAELRALQHESGQPSLRELAVLLRRAGKPYPRTTIDDKLAGRSAPTWDFVAAFVQSCATYRDEGDTTAAAAERLRAQLAGWHDRYLGLRKALAADHLSTNRHPSPVTPSLGPDETATPPRAADRTARQPWQLPAPVTGFTGRQAEQAALGRMIAEPEPEAGAPVALLSGMAGAGKTALAIRFAHLMRGRFPDGALYVDLRGYDPAPPVPPQRVLTGFLRALGVLPGEIPFEADERTALYRSVLAGRRMLVLLDNASSADQVRPLLPTSPGSLALVTSRDRLAGLVSRDGAVRIPVGPLPAFDAAALFRRLVARPADSPQEVDEMVGLAGGLPLAVRILADSATTSAASSLREVIGQVRAQRSLLRETDPAGDPRSDLSAVFSWSYLKLSPAASATFRAMSVHPTTDIDESTLSAALDIDTREVRATLDALANSHLVERRTSSRWGMHDLLRDYAASQLDAQPPGQRDAVLDRMIAHFQASASAAMRLAYPEAITAANPPNGGQWATPTFGDREGALRWLEEEREALVSCVTVAARAGRPDAAIALALTLWVHLDTAGHFADTLQIEQVALDCARNGKDAAIEGQIRYRLGAAYYRALRYHDALVELRAAVGAHRRVGDLGAEGSDHNVIGLVYASSGDYVRSVAALTRARRLIEPTGRSLGVGYCLDNLGRTHRIWGRLDRAEDCHERALAVLRSAGARTGQGQVVANLALTDVITGRWHRATDRANEAIELCPRTAPMGHGWALEALARVALSLGRPEEAADRVDLLIDLHREFGYGEGLADVLNLRAQVVADLGDAAQAESIFRRALSSTRAEPMDRCGSWLGLGGLAAAAGETDEALTMFRQAQVLAEQLDLWYERARAADGLALVHDLMGDGPTAQAFSAQAQAWYRRVGAHEARRVASESAVR